MLLNFRTVELDALDTYHQDAMCGGSGDPLDYLIEMEARDLFDVEDVDDAEVEIAIQQYLAN